MAARSIQHLTTLFMGILLLASSTARAFDTLIPDMNKQVNSGFFQAPCSSFLGVLNNANCFTRVSVATTQEVQAAHDAVRSLESSHNSLYRQVTTVRETCAQDKDQLQKLISAQPELVAQELLKNQKFKAEIIEALKAELAVGR